MHEPLSWRRCWKIGRLVHELVRRIVQRRAPLSDRTHRDEVPKRIRRGRVLVLISAPSPAGVSLREGLDAVTVVARKEVGSLQRERESGNVPVRECASEGLTHLQECDERNAG